MKSTDVGDVCSGFTLNSIYKFMEEMLPKTQLIHNKFSLFAFSSYLKMRSPTYMAVCAVAIMVVVLARSNVSMAVTCLVSDLSYCMPAFSSAAPPSGLCCNKLKQQSPCLCQYIRNPSLKQYITSPNAKKVSSICGVTFPAKC